MKVQSGKAKGRRLQNWVRDLLLQKYHSLEPDDIRSAPMGVNGEDIQLSPLARKLLPVSIECKSNKKMALYSWYDQAKSNTPKGCEPIVIAKGDRKNPVVIIDAKYFFENFNWV